MNTPLVRPNAEEVLKGLKDFQRDTVEYVFNRLYKDPHPTRRFLVADEVGLGKTLVAKGIIAKAVNHLWDSVDRLDIVYICSNSDIAKQNINRLNISIAGQEKFTLTSRITLLPTKVSELEDNKLNFISFTPGTSFDLKSSLGTYEERALLYWLLDSAWHIKGSAPLNVLQGYADKDNFRNYVSTFNKYHNIDKELAEQFAVALKRECEKDRKAGKLDLKSRFNELCERFSYARKNIPEDDASERAKLVGELRSLLAATCLKALEPDLVILDEFQRFKSLLTGDDEASQLAQKLFEYSDEQSSVRVLLLSATPYKMYTLSHEASDDHYQDFIDTMRFLLHDEKEASELEGYLQKFRSQLYSLGDDRVEGEAARHLKEQVEFKLRKVMVRTERLAVSDDRNGMLLQIDTKAPRLEKTDAESYIGVQKIADILKQGDVLHYWKAAPYLLNFMDDYELKRSLKRIIGLPAETDVANALAANAKLLFPWKEWSKYRQIDPGNARLRALVEDTLDAGAWQLLWMPPAQPYYHLGGAYANKNDKNFTKRLVFSAWRVVPKAISTFLSYEAERRMICSFQNDAENSPEARKRRRPLLRFALSDGRLTGMPVLSLLYPSETLATKVDPLKIAAKISAVKEGTNLPDVSEVLSHVAGKVKELLQHISGDSVSSGSEDESWYWAAPILLDLYFAPNSTRAWFSRPTLASIWTGDISEKDTNEDDSHWSGHVQMAQELVESGMELGRQPSDLPLVLAQMAIAGPGVAALRALSRFSETSANLIKDNAAAIAWSFRTLFNLPDVTSLIRGINGKEPYWRRVLEYCVDGCLQSTLDEYIHIQRDLLGLKGEDTEEGFSAIVSAVSNALTIRTVTLGVDEVKTTDREISFDRKGMRARFALRFGDENSDGEKEVTRAGQVREAFNSPFWPFVLATTSVGQEGLDFHPYCHAIVHWDLPSNPVDLEQREGRVHRYKGHAIRKNVATRYGMEAIKNISKQNGRPVDLWDYMFAAAERDRNKSENDMVPFWIYTVPNGSKIERHVPLFPLSRDQERLSSLRRALAVYRMVFGQPRQEDLLEFLLGRLTPQEVERLLDELQVSLVPPKTEYTT